METQTWAVFFAASGVRDVELLLRFGGFVPSSGSRAEGRGRDSAVIDRRYSRRKMQIFENLVRQRSASANFLA